MSATELSSHAPVAERIPLKDLITLEQKRRRISRLRWGIFALVLVGGSVATWAALRPKPTPIEARFRFESANRGEVVREVLAVGHLEAVTTVEVGAEISGRVATVEVDFNDHVTRGQVLARFDRASLQAQLAQIDATLRAARSALAEAMTARDRAIQDRVRAETLFTRGATSAAERDAARSNANLAEQRIAGAQAQIAAQQAAYAIAQTNLEHAVVVSPIDGVVITRNIDPGQVVASMFQTPVLFTVAASLQAMQVVAAIDEADVGELAPDQHVTFTVDAFPDRVFEGKVHDIRNAPVVIQDIVTYAATIEIENHDLALRPGMTASTHIRTASVQNATYVPSRALLFTPAGAPTASTPGVWVLQNGELRRISVQTGVTNGQVTVILNDAVPPGTRVITDFTPNGRAFYGISS